MAATADFEDIRRLVAAGRLRVGEDGSVFTRRLFRGGKLGRWKEPKPELVHPSKRPERPYARVRICGFRILVHRLVWMSYRGPIPDGLEIDHLDGDKLNNALANLDIVTPRENQARAIERGLLDPHRPRNRSLDWETVNMIRTLAKSQSQASIARELGVSVYIVNRIVKGKTYKRRI